MEEEAKGTRTESSGGAGDHPLPAADDRGGDPQVGERHEEATRTLRESNPPVTGEETSGTTSGG